MDFTRVNTFLTCPEKYRLTYLESLQKIQEDRVDAPRKFGQAIHAGLQRLYTPSMTAQEAHMAFLAVFPEALDPEDMARTPVNGLKLLDAYRHYWANQDREWKVLGVEVVDQVEIGTVEPWEVKLDLIVDTPNGIMGVDHKTTARREGFTESYWRGFEPNSQVSGYTYYLLKKYGQCSGFLINGLAIGWNQRAGKRHPQGFWYEFQRQLFNRSERQLEDWRLRMVGTMTRMRATTALRPEDVWEKNESMCGYCPFRELCLSVGDEQVKSTLYAVSDNPLAYLQETR